MIWKILYYANIILSTSSVVGIREKNSPNNAKAVSSEKNCVKFNFYFKR